MHAFVVNVYVFMTCEGIQNFDLVEQNKIVVGTLEEGSGRPPGSFASSGLPVTVPALCTKSSFAGMETFKQMALSDLQKSSFG